MGAMASPLLGPGRQRRVPPPRPGPCLVPGRSGAGIPSPELGRDPRRRGPRRPRCSPSRPPHPLPRRDRGPVASPWPPSPSSCTPNAPRPPPSPDRSRRGSKAAGTGGCRSGTRRRPVTPCSSTTRRGRRRRPAPTADPRRLDATVDLAVSLGGDGTMLRTVALAWPTAPRSSGVNFGRLGYLTEVEPDGLEPRARALPLRRLRRRGAHHPRGDAAAGAGPTPPTASTGGRAQRGCRGEDRAGPHHPGGGLDRGAPLRHLRRRRAPRGHADGLDRLQPLGPGAHPQPGAAGVGAHAGVAAHALRPPSGARARAVGASRAVGARDGPCSCSTGRVPRCSSPATAWCAGWARHRRAS